MFLLQTNLYIVRFKTDIPGHPTVTTENYKYLPWNNLSGLQCVTLCYHSQPTGVFFFVRSYDKARELLCYRCYHCYRCYPY